MDRLYMESPDISYLRWILVHYQDDFVAVFSAF